MDLLPIWLVCYWRSASRTAELCRKRKGHPSCHCFHSRVAVRWEYHSAQRSRPNRCSCIFEGGSCLTAAMCTCEQDIRGCKHRYLLGRLPWEHCLQTVLSRPRQQERIRKGTWKLCIAISSSLRAMLVGGATLASQ